MKIEKITIYPGHNKDGEKENYDKLNVVSGNTVSIVGPTGSGKTSFVNDIEMLTQGDTITGRKIKVNGKTPSLSFRRDASQNPIVLITQHTNFLADLTIDEFLTVHAKARKIKTHKTVEKTILLTNKLTGEKVSEKMQQFIDDKANKLEREKARKLRQKENRAQKKKSEEPKAE